MEFIANFPFKLNCKTFRDWFLKNKEIGEFNNSSWSFEFVPYGMKITRSNTSLTYDVISAFNILYKNQRLQKDCFRKCIVGGEAHVIFPYDYTNINEFGLAEFSGSITILQLPASSSKETQVTRTELIPPSVETTLPKVLEDFLRLLNDPESFPDATFKCGAEEFLVHKAILSARSSVFAAMFKTEMQESNSGVVDIVDIEPNVLQSTLKYVYSGKTDHLNDGIAEDVLFAANKYQLEDLKKVCIEILKTSMTVDNVFRTLVLGDMHDECLKMRAKEFICECDTFSNLEKSEGWKLLQSEKPGLAIEVLLFVVKYEQNFSTKIIASK